METNVYLKKIAYHEAGHAIVGISLGSMVEYIDLEDERIKFKNISCDDYQLMMIDLAGIRAQMIIDEYACFYDENYEQQDYIQFKERFATSKNIDHAKYQPNVEYKGFQIPKKHKDEFEKMFNEVIERVDFILNKYNDLLVSLAEELLLREVLCDIQIELILSSLIEDLNQSKTLQTRA